MLKNELKPVKDPQKLQIHVQPLKRLLDNMQIQGLPAIRVTLMQVDFTSHRFGIL